MAEPRRAASESRGSKSRAAVQHDADRAALRVHEALMLLDAFVPVGRLPGEVRLWCDCELASLAENRLGDRADPRSLDRARRSDWLARAGGAVPGEPEHRGDDLCYWIQSGPSVRGGSVAISTTTICSDIWVSALYVFPDHRGRGLARAALARIRDLADREGLGLRLSVEWTSQRALGMYLRMGMWVQMWKRDIDLRWSGSQPAPIVRMDGDQATLAVLSNGAPEVLCRATRTGASLRLEDAGACDPRAPTTLAVWLATCGWPLLSGDPDAAGPASLSDLVDPEGLASRIQHWETWNHEHGWQVNTPRIPGLEYPARGGLDERGG
jgi:GNAT superfamily N-acetyltransferase